MKLTPLAALLVLTLGFVHSAIAETYKLDPVHSSIVFRVMHLQVSYVYGRFNDVSGTFSYDPAAPEKSTFSFEVDAKSIDTANARRDNHLRSADFFDVEKHPKITFKSTAVKPAGDKALEVTGDLTLHGVTKPITVTMTHTGTGPHPQGGVRTGFETEFTVNRSEYGMQFMIPGVSDEVKLMIGLQGVRQ